MALLKEGESYGKDDPAELTDEQLSVVVGGLSEKKFEEYKYKVLLPILYESYEDNIRII